MQPLSRAAAALAGLVLFALPAPLAAQTIDPVYVPILTQDAPGAADPELTGRYDGAVIIGQRAFAFDELTLPAGPAEGTNSDNARFPAQLSGQGRVTRTLYLAPAGRSSLEVLKGYADALAAQGFAPVFDCAREACGERFGWLKYRWDAPQTHVLSEGSSERQTAVVRAMFDRITDPRYVLMRRGDDLAAVYAAVNGAGTYGNISEALKNRVGVLVEIVETGARENRMVTTSAAAIGEGLGSDGRVVLEGIFFDFDQATIKPESREQLEEMRAFMAANPGLSVWIIGHTDSRGALDYNLRLSEARAEAVRAALADLGVEPGRMQARGLGPLAPRATNRTDAGQALNRRVEMVEQ